MYVRLISNAAYTMDQIADRFAKQRFCHQWIETAKLRQDEIGHIASRISRIKGKGTAYENVSVLDEIAPRVSNSALSLEFENPSNCKFFARAKVGLIFLHSLAYRRIQNTCSYIACFDVVDELKYGTILQFVVYGQTVYAYVQLFSMCSENITEDVPPINKHLKSLWHQKLYGTFYKCVKLSDNFEFLPVYYVKCRCIMVTVGDKTFLTETAHMYEHN